MDSILVVNAGSSSIKFEIFAIAGGNLERRIKGQMDGIGTRPRLRAAAHDGASLIDKSYDAHGIADVPAAMAATGDWLRGAANVDLRAVGHRVVHGGPDYKAPVLIDAAVLKRLEQYN